jgi:hypothetical protein
LRAVRRLRQGEPSAAEPRPRKSVSLQKPTHNLLIPLNRRK